MGQRRKLYYVLRVCIVQVAYIDTLVAWPTQIPLLNKVEGCGLLYHQRTKCNFKLKKKTKAILLNILYVNGGIPIQGGSGHQCIQCRCSDRIPLNHRHID